jgi:hypothetical protein
MHWVVQESGNLFLRNEKMSTSSAEFQCGIVLNITQPGTSMFSATKFKPVQLNFTAFAPDTVEPEPVLAVVAQPTASPTTSSNPALEVIHAILSLPCM